MLDLHRCRHALMVCATITILGGCGSQSGVKSAVPQNLRTTTKSLAQPGSSSGGDLLYVMMGHSGAHVLTYPGDQPVAKIKVWGFSASNPNNGEVLIGGVEGGVNLYQHGGTKPIYEFYPPSEYFFVDSAFDPTSDNIAISAFGEFHQDGYVAVYAPPYGTPTSYTVPKIQFPNFVGYDNQGNLFVDDSCCMLAELRKGGTEFTDLTISEQFKKMGSIQWDGNYVAVTNGSSISRLQVSGSAATVVSRTKLRGAWGAFGDFWIQGDTVIGPHLSDPPHNGRDVGFWHYPQGGGAYKIITNLSKSQKDRMASATVSVGP